MLSLSLQYQSGARLPFIVDQPRRRATFILSFGNPCNIREAHPCQDKVDPRYVRWIYTSARQLSSTSPFSLRLAPPFPLLAVLLTFLRSRVSVTRSIDLSFGILVAYRHRLLFVRLSRKMDVPCRWLLRVHGILGDGQWNMAKCLGAFVMRNFDPFLVRSSIFRKWLHSFFVCRWIAG